MLIDIKLLKVLWYGGIKPGRQEKLEKHLKNLNIEGKKVDPIIHVNGIIGCKESAKKTLQLALKHNEPVLVLEDDCSPTDWYRSTIEVPDDADALYLGTSVRGLTVDWKYKDYRKDPIWVGVPSRLEEGKDVYKINNMLTTHAILYITKKYKEYCYNLLEYCVFDDMPCDVLYAAGMGKHNVYAVKFPFFYQDCSCIYTRNDTIRPLCSL